MKNCPHCGKTFKTFPSLHKHLIICQIDKKELKEITVIPTHKEMWYLIQKLHRENEKQKKKIEKLEEVINKDVKKINMLDWLNQNDMGIDIDIWLKKDVSVTLEDLNLIFITDYTRGLSTILSNNILDTNNTPFRAFSHKIKQLYIFQKNKWKKSTKKDIIKIFDRLQLNILKRSKDYDNSLSRNERYGTDNIQYLKNTQKIMIVDTKKRERYYKYIENSIIDLTKKNLNDMAKFKFYL
jgi:hypothetical protein